MRSGRIGVFFYPKTFKMAAASLFEQINVNIGDIGNHGTRGDDLANLIVEIANSQNKTKQAEELRAQKERERRIILAGGASVGLGLFLLIIYLLSQKQRNNGRS